MHRYHKTFQKYKAQPLYHPCHIQFPQQCRAIFPPVSVADLAVTKAGDSNPIITGENLTYTITVTNLGPDAATGVTAIDTLPAGATFNSTTPSQGTYTYDPNSNQVTCNLGILETNASATVMIQVTPITVGEIVNTVTVVGEQLDPHLANNTASTTTTVLPAADLAVSKEGKPSSVIVDENVTYTIITTNLGPDTATGVTATDTLPATVTLDSIISSQGNCTYNPTTNEVTCSLGTITSSASATVTIQVTPTTPGVIINTVTVTGDQFDPNLANNKASVTTTVSPVADLAVTKTGTPDPSLVGENVTYTIITTNLGPDTATGVTATDTLPVNVTVDNTSSSQGSCTYDPLSNTVTCNLGTLSASSSATVTIQVTSTTTSEFVNTVTVIGEQFDPNLANNTATTTSTSQSQLERAYVTNTGDNTVSVINISNNTIAATISVGNNPTGVALTPDGKQAYVVNADDNTVSVINTTTNTVTTTIPFAGSYPLEIAITPDGAKAYVTNNGNNSITVIDTTINTILTSIYLEYGNILYGVAITPNRAQAYVTSMNGGTEAGTFTGTVTIIDTATDTIVDGITVGNGPEGVAITSDGKQAYVANFDDNTISVIDTATLNVTATIPIGPPHAPIGPSAIAITPDETKAYVANFGNNTVSVIDTATNTITTTISVGGAPLAIAITLDGTEAYVVNDGSNNVSIIDTNTDTVTGTIAVGTDPLGIAIGLVSS
jgi:uncharacterized repeat protein (TIGR01451 family)